MPLDGKNWKPDLSLDGFIGWMETKPQDESYVWSNHRRCLLAEFGKACGTDFFDVHKILSAQTNTHFDCIAYKTPHTYGSALKRARALKDATGEP